MTEITKILDQIEARAKSATSKGGVLMDSWYIAAHDVPTLVQSLRRAVHTLGIYSKAGKRFGIDAPVALNDIAAILSRSEQK